MVTSMVTGGGGTERGLFIARITQVRLLFLQSGQVFTFFFIAVGEPPLRSDKSGSTGPWELR